MIKGHPEDFYDNLIDRLFHFEPASATKVAISIATTVAATGVSVYGQMQQANAAENSARYNAQLAALDQEQNRRNREIEKVQDKKRFY